ncbi:MAG: hypothetical protein ABIK83_11580 [Candidatus Zixiibacteriota bacterium]
MACTVGWRLVYYTQKQIICCTAKGKMIPDFKEAKEKLSEHFMRYIKARTMQYLGPLAMPVSQVFEGGTTLATVMDDGKVFESDLETHKGEITISFDDIKSGNVEKVKGSLDEIANQMAQAQATMILGRVSELCDEVGNTVNGQPFTGDTFLAVLRRCS